MLARWRIGWSWSSKRKRERESGRWCSKQFFFRCDTLRSKFHSSEIYFLGLVSGSYSSPMTIGACLSLRYKPYRDGYLRSNSFMRSAWSSQACWALSGPRLMLTERGRYRDQLGECEGTVGGTQTWSLCLVLIDGTWGVSISLSVHW